MKSECKNCGDSPVFVFCSRCWLLISNLEWEELDYVNMRYRDKKSMEGKVKK